MGPSVFDKIDDVRTRLNAEAQARVDRDEALCPNCATVHAAKTEDGLAYCPTCKAKCPRCGGDYSDYSTAPHCGVVVGACTHRDDGLTRHCAGRLPREDWPDCFTEDPEAPGFGTWTCPVCRGVDQSMV